MRSMGWFIIVVIALVLSTISTIKQFTDIDIVALAVLLSIATYILSRYLYSLYLGIHIRFIPRIDLGNIMRLFIYLELVVLLGIAVDYIVTALVHEFTLSTSISILTTTSILYLIRRFYGFKIVLLLLSVLIPVVGILCVIGVTDATDAWFASLDRLISIFDGGML